VLVLVLVLVLETSPDGFAGLRTCTTKPFIDSQLTAWLNRDALPTTGFGH
jgi:hypothetical protein